MIHASARPKGLALLAPLAFVAAVASFEPASAEASTSAAGDSGGAEPGLPLDPADVAREARALLDRFRAEPSVRETQEAAVRHAGIEAARLASWRRRVRLAAAAPELLAEYRRASAADRTLGEQASGTVDYSDLDLEDRYTARARWQLDRLVFDPDELRVSAESIEVVELRQAVVDQVTRLYFERRRQQVRLLGEALGLDDRLGVELRVEELTASLDGLTGGWFSARLGDRAPPIETSARPGGRGPGFETSASRGDRAPAFGSPVTGAGDERDVGPGVGAADARAAREGRGR